MDYENLRSVQLLYSGPDCNPSGEEASKITIREEADKFWKVYCFTEKKPLASELLLQFMDIIGDRDTQGRKVHLVPIAENKLVEPPKLSY